MNKFARIAFPLWTMVVILFFFAPMGGSTGFEAAISDGSILPILGVIAGIGCWVALLIMLIRSWLR